MATRTGTVTVALAPDEREAIAAAARIEGLTVAAFMRWAALRAARND